MMEKPKRGGYVLAIVRNDLRPMDRDRPTH
jgi:hypothetical protein